jgi:ankyrin repeat protein
MSKSLLSTATELGNLELVKDLVEHGADIHENENGPLKLAIWNGHLEVVKYLVEHGADIHAGIGATNGMKILKSTARLVRMISIDLNLMMRLVRACSPTQTSLLPNALGCKMPELRTTS